MNNKTFVMTALFILILSLSACGSASHEDRNTGTTETKASYITPEISDGKLQIDTALLSGHPLYVNYVSKGTTIQLLAVNASDGLHKLSLNTCQACNPSPKAYFQEEDGRLVCQNCGNVFEMDSVGTSSQGCNPMSIEYEEAGDYLVVDVAVLDGYSDKFSSWEGPVE